MELNQNGEFSMTRDPEKTNRSFQAAGIVTGTYTLSGDSVMMNARFVSLVDGKIIAAQDFILEQDKQIKHLIRQDKAKQAEGWYNSVDDY